MKKKIIALCMTIVMMLQLMVVPAMAAETQLNYGTYTIETKTITGKAGEKVSLAVTFNSTEAITALGFDIFEGFDENVLEFVGFVENEQFKAAYSDKNKIWNFDNEMQLVSIRFDNEYKFDTTTLCNLEFKLLKDMDEPIEVVVMTAAKAEVDNKMYDCTVVPGAVNLKVEHVHAYTWAFNDTHHWQVCSCGDKTAEAAHEMNWVVETAATMTVSGKKVGTCECGYKKEAEILSGKQVLENIIWEATDEDTVKTADDAKAYVEAIAKEELKKAGFVNEAEMISIDVTTFVAASNGEDGYFTFTISYEGQVVFGPESITIIANEVENKKTGLIFPRLFDVKVECGEGGSVNTSKTFKMAYGSTRTIKITADEGYEVADVIVNGKSVGAVEKYTIKGARTTYTVKVLFEEIDG